MKTCHLTSAVHSVVKPAGQLALTITLSLALSLASVTPAMAKVAAGKTVNVNPTLLRTRLISDNTDIMTALNTLYSAKANVSLARAGLMPSLNIGAALNFNPVSFALSSVSALLPFLLPSNWYALDMSQHQLAASGYAYYIVELNTYASALGLYETIQEDIALRGVYYEQYQNYLKIQNFVEIQTALGHDILADLQQATAQTEAALATVSNFDAVIAGEIAQLRRALGYDESVTMNLQEWHPDASPYESQTPQKVFNTVFAKSPEEQQLQSLILAAKDGIGEAQFSWLSSATLTAAQGAGHSVSFAQAPILGGGLTISATILPNIELKSLAAAAAQTVELAGRENALATIETAVRSVGDYAAAFDSYSQAVDNNTSAFNGYFTLLALNQTDLEKVLVIANNLGLSKIAKVQARFALDNTRINLLRATISSPFAGIPTCKMINTQSSSGGGIFGFLGGIFSPGPDATVSVDQICKTGIHARQVASTVPQTAGGTQTTGGTTITHHGK